MNNMDEITYWIYTKRAPCLMKYDLDKKNSLQAQCSKPKIDDVIHSISDATETPSPKKKKRKLSILDDDSGSAEEKPNLFFDTSNQKVNHQTLISSSKSDSIGDIDFNIKKSSVQVKCKRAKLQRKGRTIHKKNRIISSTPINTNLRRSLRNSRKVLNDSNPLNTSFELLTSSPGLNGAIEDNFRSPAEIDYVQPAEKCKKSLEKVSATEVITVNGKCSNAAEKQKVIVNGEFENLSDVSGFTASYIRSTKSALKRKNKSRKSLLKESKKSIDSKLIVNVNKGVNTGMHTALNFSTDSSQNCVNLVTNESQGKTSRANKSTSVLKFVTPKTSKVKQTSKVEDNITSNTELELSAELQSPQNRRYPKRFTNNSNEEFNIFKLDTTLESEKANTRRRTCKKSNSNNNNLEQASPRKSVRRKLPQDAVLVFNPEQKSSGVTLNVGSPRGDGDSLTKNKRLSSIRRRKSPNKSAKSAGGRDSLREKSGFTACFSDSDDDKPLKPQKFFC